MQAVRRSCGNSIKPRRSSQNAAFFAFCRLSGQRLLLVVGQDASSVLSRTGSLNSRGKRGITYWDGLALRVVPIVVRPTSVLNRINKLPSSLHLLPISKTPNGFTFREIHEDTISADRLTRKVNFVLKSAMCVAATDRTKSHSTNPSRDGQRGEVHFGVISLVFATTGLALFHRGNASSSNL